MSPVLYALFLCLHLLAATLWVGGMAVMHVAVRPAAVQTLEVPQRLAFLCDALGRFFAWVVAAVLVLPVTGFLMMAASGGMRGMHWRIHAMLGIGLVMIAIFARIRLLDYPRLQRAVAAAQWPAAGAAMAQLRRWVSVNLLLGIAVFLIVLLGRAL